MTIISSNRHAATRHIAQRTCVACRQTKDKKELVRLVCTPEGELEIDKYGKRPGRGAYLCPTPACWETALRGNKLEHSLRRSLNRDKLEQLFEQSKEIVKGVNEW